MAASSDALTAAAAYRSQQLAIRAAFLRDALALWPVLDKANLSRTSPDWLRLMTALITRWWKVSAVAGQEFYVAQRRLERVPGTIGLTLPAPLADDVILRNLLHSALGELKGGRARGWTPERTDASAMTGSAENGARLVMLGGRTAVDEAVTKDNRALGWMRVTDGDPCAFCAMLASRGAVYKTAATAGFESRDPRDIYSDEKPVSHYHDSCGCQVVPVFTRNPPLSAEAKRFDALWASTTSGLSGNDARIAFRRAIESR